MRNNLLNIKPKKLLILFIIANIGLLQAQYTAIPDSGFEQTLINQGIDSEGILDGRVLTSDINTITYLDLYNYAGDGIAITDLTGIEDFTALENLNLEYQGLSELHLNNNTELKVLNCSFNSSLTDIDISQNVNLEYINCSYIGDIWGGINIDFSHNVNLKYLIAENSSLNRIVLSSNINLKVLKLMNDTYDDFGMESNIVSLDLSNHIWLEHLECYNTNLETIILPNTNTLTYIDLVMQELTTIDVSQNQNLEHLDLSLNYNLASLDVTNNQNLKYLDVNKCNLTQLDVSQNSQLEKLYVGYLWLNNVLQELPYNNSIQNIDLSHNAALKWLLVRNINLNTLDVSNNVNLLALNAEKNNIQTIDLTNNLLLKRLIVNENPIQNLDLSINTALEYLSCENTDLNTLNLKNGHNQILNLAYLTNNPNLTCIEVDNEIDANNNTGAYSNWEKDATAIYSEDCSSGVEENDTQLNIELYPNPTKDNLYILNDSLKNIDFIKVYNSLGKEVLMINHNFSKIDLTGLHSGLYLVRVKSKNSIKNLKVLKE